MTATRTCKRDGQNDEQWHASQENLTVYSLCIFFLSVSISLNTHTPPPTHSFILTIYLSIYLSQGKDYPKLCSINFSCACTLEDGAGRTCMHNPFFQKDTLRLEPKLKLYSLLTSSYTVYIYLPTQDNPGSKGAWEVHHRHHEGKSIG